LTVSEDAVRRVLRKDGIQLRRRRSWCISTDEQFAMKAASSKVRRDTPGFWL